MNISVTIPKSKDAITVIITNDGAMTDPEIASVFEYLASEYKSQHIQRSNDESRIDPTQIADGNETISSET